jgi:hypothetical protein
MLVHAVRNAGEILRTLPAIRTFLKMVPNFQSVRGLQFPIAISP